MIIFKISSYCAIYGNILELFFNVFQKSFRSRETFTCMYIFNYFSFHWILKCVKNVRRYTRYRRYHRAFKDARNCSRPDRWRSHRKIVKAKFNKFRTTISVFSRRLIHRTIPAYLMLITSIPWICIYYILWGKL